MGVLCRISAQDIFVKKEINMGRAGGGSRGGGGGFSRGGSSFSRSSGSSLSRSSIGRSGSSFSRSSSGRSSSSFGSSGHIGGFGGHYHRPRPIHIHPGYGRRTVIINNSGNTTYTGTNTNNTGNTNAGPGSYTGTTSQQTYTAPKEITPEQKLARAERMAKEAADNKKGSVKFFFISLVLLAIGVFLTISTKPKEFEKYNLSGTVDVGYTYDDGFTEGSGMTEAACNEFYIKTGIPLYFYTVKEYDKSVSTCDNYTIGLYSGLFKDENHVLIAYYDNVNWWSWEIGDKVEKYMSESDVNDLLDEIDYYWDDYSLTNDQVLAKGIANYQEKLTAVKDNGNGLATILIIVGLVLLVIAIYQFINYGSDAKKYEEEAKKLQREIILSKPLETFGNQEVEDLKDKYDKM